MNKKGFYSVLILILFILTSCAMAVPTKNDQAEGGLTELSKSENSEASEDLYLISTSTEVHAEISGVLESTSTPTPNPTPTPVPTQTPTLTSVWNSEINGIRSIMQDYGFVEEYYLTEEYWSTLHNRIEEFGVAERMVALEYHGNSYTFFDGAYSLDPDAFYKQMQYLMENNYHFVTIHELKGFLEGWLDLPKRSIILTTDSGAASKASFESITAQFRELESIYGYKPHMQSYIWTKHMTAAENSECQNNACWEIFLRAKETGYFTFGTHSETHPQFEFMSVDFLKEDLGISITKIRENTSLNVYAITWPHESCAWDLVALDEIGIDIGFGGLSKYTSDAFVYKNDAMYNCLPRLFPPNGGGFSSRPLGFTLEDMVLSAARENK